jgi:hypothetical protein
MLYQDFKDTVNGGTTIRAKVVMDEFAAGTTFREAFRLALGEFNRARGEGNIRRERTAGF